MSSSDSDSSDEQLEAYKSRLMASLEKRVEAEPKLEDHDGPSFEDLGICSELCSACRELGWKKPTNIQIEAIPPALAGNDVIGLAETGSGKTAAFTIPILQSLLDKPQRLYALVLAPTRELCVQITEQFKALGSSIALDVCIILGGLDMVSQALQLSKRPHIIVGSPGRLADHLENTKGFTIETMKFLVLDEADRLLSMDFDDALDKILHAMPKERRTFLFSATMTSKVAKLQKVSLVKPVKVHVNTKYSTSQLLVQKYLLVPLKFKWTYLAALMVHFGGYTAMIFCNTCLGAQKCCLYLRNLQVTSICLHGKLSQMQRLGALNGFKSGNYRTLVVTDVGSRGLDIPSVDLVINFDIPQSSKDYIHRVGRTARAGRTGTALTIVTQYDVEPFQRIEFALGKKLEEFVDVSEDTALSKHEEYAQALRTAELESKDAASIFKRKGKFASRYERAKKRQSR